jgi:glycosyltransferase involved in cell wall biosynthesis
MRGHEPDGIPTSSEMCPRGGLAIVAEQVGEFGGSERVLATILSRYPGATLVAERFTGADVPDSVALPWSNPSRLFGPGGRRRHFLMPLYARRYATQRPETASLVLALVHYGWGLAARGSDGARWVAYSAGLPRAFYGYTDHYLDDYSAPLRPLLRAALPAIRLEYRRLVDRVDRLLTNSAASARALSAVHHRPVEVVYPPVKTRFFTPAPRRRHHYLVTARMTPFKRIEVVIDAFHSLDSPLVIAGSGPLLKRLRHSLPPNVRLTGFVSDEELRELYRCSRALICPSVEEFGLVMAEALATGTPVVAPRAGGAMEIVADGETGILLDEVTPESVTQAIRTFEDMRFDPQACRGAAERFGEERFLSELDRVMTEELTHPRHSEPRDVRSQP